MRYKSHNEIIQRFCVTLYQKSQEALPPTCEPTLIFDRGFDRGKYVIKFLKAEGIPFVTRVCRNVRITVWGTVKTVEQLKTTGFYPQILYHPIEKIRLNLYVMRDARFDEPMYLISSHLKGHQIYRCYKRRMKIEHGFRDIKTGFGFGSLILNKPTKEPINLLWMLDSLSYRLLFIIYEKSGDRWTQEFNTKTYSLITVIKRVLPDAWLGATLNHFFTLTLGRVWDSRNGGDTLQHD